MITKHKIATAIVLAMIFIAWLIVIILIAIAIITIPKMWLVCLILGILVGTLYLSGRWWGNHDPVLPRKKL